MPSNLYGVANAPIVTAIGGQGSVTCPAGSTTIVMGIGPIIAPSQGFYYPAIWWLLDFTMGATVPNPIQFGFRIGAGSNLDTTQLNPAIEVANATINMTICMFGPASSTPWLAPGSTINCVITPNLAGVTANPSAGRAWFALFRAPDQ